MEGIVYDWILLEVLMGLRAMELWEIMTSSDVRAIAQYLKKNKIFQNFGSKSSVVAQMVAMSPEFLNFQNLG